jgi:hypothetical protein
MTENTMTTAKPTEEDYGQAVNKAKAAFSFIVEVLKMVVISGSEDPPGFIVREKAILWYQILPGNFEIAVTYKDGSEIEILLTNRNLGITPGEDAAVSVARRKRKLSSDAPAPPSEGFPPYVVLAALNLITALGQTYQAGITYMAENNSSEFGLGTRIADLS